MDRKEYWNSSYVKYWKERVDEANSGNSFSNIIKGDKVTSSDETYKWAVDMLNIKKDDFILDMGCGFGRGIPFLCSKTPHVYAIDISEEMISSATQLHSKQFPNVKFYTSEAEKTPFRNETFDNIVCFAVFDALYQKDALIEINRILRTGGRALISGKNDCYYSDDNEAKIAEINARKKGHPNYFTDVRLLMNNIDSFGFILHSAKFFLRRGDFAKRCYLEQKTEKFYEFLFVLEKKSEIEHEMELEISNSFSKTFIYDQISE